MMRKLSLLALVSLTAGCMAEPGASIQLVNVMKPDQQCQYKADGKDVLFEGFYDPAAGDDKMSITVRVMNSMNAPDTDPRTNDNNANLKPSGNTVSINGFNVCYKAASDLSEFGSGDSGNALNCDDIINATEGEYKEFIPAGGIVEPDPSGQDTGAPVAMELFSKTALQGLFGDGFSTNLEYLLTTEREQAYSASGGVPPTCLADGVGVDDAGNPVANDACTTLETTTVNIVDVSRNSQVITAGETTENVPWGFWNQDSRPQQRIVVAIQAVGMTTAGSVVKSNWLNYPVDLCPGCTVVSEECDIDAKLVLCSQGTCQPPSTENDADGNPIIPPALDCDENGPKGLANGASACPGFPSLPCTGFKTETRTYEDIYEGYCIESQKLGTNIIGACFSEDPCAAE